MDKIKKTLNRIFTPSVKAPLIYLSLVFLPLVIIYRSIISSDMRWAVYTENQWQFLILPILCYMVWSKQNELASINYRPSFFLGLPLLFIAVVLHTYGLIFLHGYMIELSVLFFLFGFSLLLSGIQITCLLFWPLLYGLLATSLFTLFQSFITPTLQISAATCGVKLLNLTGFHTVQSGTFFRLPGGVLNVADSCSGFNQLLTLMALSIPLFYRFLSSWKLQFLVLVLTFPVSILMNSLRITFIGMWNYSALKQDVHGPYDIFYAPFIFLVGVLLIYVITMWLTRFEKNPTNKSQFVKQAVKPTALIIIVIFGVVIESTKLYLYRNKSKEQPVISQTTSPLWVDNGPIDVLPNTVFQRNNRHLKADFSYSRQFNKDGIQIDFFYSWFAVQTPGNSVQNYMLPNGKDEQCNLVTAEKNTFPINCRTIELNNDTGTIFWWYSADTEISGKNNLKHLITNNMLTKGNPGASLILFYFPGKADGILLKNSVQELYNSLEHCLIL